MGERDIAFVHVAAGTVTNRVFATTNHTSEREVRAFTAGGGGVSSYVRYGTATVTRPVLFPDEQRVTDDTGHVYRASDLAVVGSFGSACNDIAFLGDGTPVVLRQDTLTATRRTISSRPAAPS